MGRERERGCASTRSLYHEAMTLDFLPPLLRGIGTTIILIAALLSFTQAHQSTDQQRKQREQKIAAFGARSPALSELARLSEEVEELRLEAEEDTIVEKVFENRWFEWLGFVGTSFIAGSFYLESFIKRPRRKMAATVKAERGMALEEAIK